MIIPNSHCRKSFFLLSLLTAFVLMCSSSLFADTFYVALDGANVSPYSDWSSAATNIQFAVALARDGDDVLVAPGHYIGKLFNTNGSVFEASGSMVYITNAISLRSVDGPQSTVIDVGGRHRRCLYIGHPDATVFGFTLSLGFARTNMGEQTFPTSVGGGVFFDGGGTLANSILQYNRAGLAGGNAYFNGGGLLLNCLVIEGEAPFCGGIYCDGGGDIINCTVVDNWTTATNRAGGVWCINGGSVINSIFYNNPAFLFPEMDVYTEGSGWSFAYSRVPAGLPGDGLITNNPLFVDYDNNNFHLQPLSPCAGTGSNMAWMADATDLDGTPRIQIGTVDMGAYEIPGVYYAATNGSHVSPFVTWKTAATNIADVLLVAYPGTTILVSNGIYHAADELDVRTNVTLQAVGPADQTVLLSDGLSRCLKLSHPDAVVDGFTLAGGSEPSEFGGGARINSGTLRNCIIRDNYSAQFGGGIDLQGGSAENCILFHNTAAWGGGGAIFTATGEMLNCLVYDNLSPADPLPPGFGGMRLGGGGVFFLSGGSMINCTVARNQSRNDGGGVFYMSHPSIGLVTTLVQNSIIYQNVAFSNNPNFADPENAFQFADCCTWPSVPAGHNAGGTITNDPEFVSPSFGCFRLRQSSGCVNSGSNMAWMAGTTDPDGHPRVYDGSVDIGAYEQIVHFVSLTGTHQSPYTNWTAAATNIVSALDAAEQGSLVLVAPGAYPQLPETRLTTPAFGMLSSTHGPNETFIQAGPDSSCFQLDAEGFVIDGFTLTGGSSPNPGGGVNVEQGIVQFCTITGNYSAAVGGGLWLVNKSVAFACQVTHNSAASGGGGVGCSADALVQNCAIISNNTPALPFGGGARFGGGGILMVSGGSAVNCTVAGNFSANDGGGLYYVPFFGDVPSYVHNSIVYGNAALSNGVNYFDPSDLVSYDHSCTWPALPPGADAGDNVFSNPLFAADYQLTFASPCRDSGSNMVWMLFSPDEAGNPRIVGNRVDMGAYEFIPEPLSGCALFLTGMLVLFLKRKAF